MEKHGAPGLGKRESTAGQDYFEQVQGNIYTGPVYMQGYPARPQHPRVFHNLPQPDYGQFVGREQELAQLRKLLSPRSRHFVITIDGIGGIGKSALALEIAHQFLHNYDQLGPEERFEAIVWTSAKQTVLTTDGIRTRRQVLHSLNDMYTAIAVALQREDITRASAERQDEIVYNALTRQRTLLIVDNLETVDDEAVLEFLRELPVPTKALVTTRHRLDVAYPVRLTGMPWEDAQQLIAQECKKKTVNLDEDTMRRLFDRTGGVPLAMVWSIAQMGFGYSSEAVLQRLGQPINDIAQFCFAGAIEHIKTRPAYTLLLTLSLCADSASRETLGYATELPELDRDDGLVELEKLSLVNKDGDRFWLLPLTKEFVSTEFEQFSEKERLRERWNAYFQTWTAQYSGQYWKWDNYQWLVAEGRNVFAIIDEAIAMQDHATALAFTHAAYRYFSLSGRWSMMFEYGEKFHQLAQAAHDERTIAWLYIRWLAPSYVSRDNLKQAEQFTRNGYAIYQRLNDVKGMCFALIGLARTLRKSGRLDEAHDVCQHALSIAHDHHEDAWVTSIHFELGKLARDRGQWEASKRHWQTIITWCEEHQQNPELDVFSLHSAIAQLGWVEFLSGKHLEGKALLEQRLAFLESMRSMGHVAKLHRNLAIIEKTLGNRPKALEHLQQALFWAEHFHMLKELHRGQALLQELQNEESTKTPIVKGETEETSSS